MKKFHYIPLFWLTCSLSLVPVIPAIGQQRERGFLYQAVSINPNAEIIQARNIVQYKPDRSSDWEIVTDKYSPKAFNGGETYLVDINSGSYTATGQEGNALIRFLVSQVRVRQAQNTVNHFNLDKKNCQFTVYFGQMVIHERSEERASGCNPIGRVVRANPNNRINNRSITTSEGTIILPSYTKLDTKLKGITKQNTSTFEEYTKKSSISIAVHRERLGENLASDLDEGVTKAYVLASKSPEPVLLLNQQGEVVAELSSGEYATIDSRGNVDKGIFRLRDFYDENPLVLGLGADQDEEFEEMISEIVPSEQDTERAFFEVIRADILDAIEEQERNLIPILEVFIPNNGTPGANPVSPATTTFPTVTGTTVNQPPVPASTAPALLPSVPTPLPIGLTTAGGDIISAPPAPTAPSVPPPAGIPTPLPIGLTTAGGDIISAPPAPTAPSVSPPAGIPIPISP